MIHPNTGSKITRDNAKGRRKGTSPSHISNLPRPGTNGNRYLGTNGRHIPGGVHLVTQARGYLPRRGGELLAITCV